MNIHILEKELHKDFLTQNRIDPITGDILEENDQIVICASCKSAFLLDSWNYMDNKHCNQSHTLSQIPIQETVTINRETRNERLDKLAFYQFRTVKESEAVNIYAGFFALIGLILEVILYFSLNIDFIGFGFSIVFIGWAIGKVLYKQKSLILESGNYIINQNKNNQVRIPANELETISCEKAKFFSRLANSILFKRNEEFYHLIFTTKKGEKHKIFVSEHEIKRIEQETNILKKYSTDISSLPFQNSPLITPQNNRLDLGSNF